MLGERRHQVELIAKALLEYETLDASHIREIVEFGEIKNPPRNESQPPPLPPPPVSTPNASSEQKDKDLPSGGLPAPAPA